MSAAFTYAAVYAAKAVCLSPLRTGNTQNDPDQVLCRSDGTAFVQGTSLAGAMRSWLERSSLSAWTQRLFGTRKAGGHLMVSDAVFERDAVPSVRARLAIDPETGAGKIDPKTGAGAKFELAQINAGAKLHFSVVWLGHDTAELAAVEAMLSALNASQILLGAQKSNGFGRVSVTVQWRRLDLREEKDLAVWLAWNSDTPLPDSKSLTLPQPEERPGVTFTIKARCDNLLVKASGMRAGNTGKNTTYYTPNLTEAPSLTGKETPVLPGSSVKGAVRARASAIARYLGLEDAFVEQLFGRGSNKAGSSLSGGEADNGLPGQVRFEDAQLCAGGRSARRISRIRIDRFTGGVIRQGLFTEEPLHVDELRLCITAPAQDAACGLLLYALRDLGLGLCNLGSGQAIGRGYLQAERIEVSAQGAAAALCFSRAAPESGITVAIEDPVGMLDRWSKALKEAAEHED